MKKNYKRPDIQQLHFSSAELIAVSNLEDTTVSSGTTGYTDEEEGNLARGHNFSWGDFEDDL